MAETVKPRMFLDDPAAAVEFLRAVFGATGEFVPDRPTEVRIGDTTVLVSGTAEREPFPAFLYVCVADADATYRRALEHGAASLEEPADQAYGDRRAMVRDPAGNVFQLANRV